MVDGIRPVTTLIVWVWQEHVEMECLGRLVRKLEVIFDEIGRVLLRSGVSEIPDSASRSLWAVFVILLTAP